MPDAPPPGIKNTMNAKTGGIKHKWWLVGGLAIGGVAYWYYGHNTVDNATATDTAPIDPNDPYAGYDSNYGSSLGGSYGSASGADSPYYDPAIAQAYVESTEAEKQSAAALGDIATAVKSQTPETALHWQHRAIEALVAHGYHRAAARAAILAYLAGAPMTAKQVHTVEAALGYVGHPPVNVPSIHQIATPKPARKDPRTPPHKKAAPVKTTTTKRQELLTLRQRLARMRRHRSTTVVSRA